MGLAITVTFEIDEVNQTGKKTLNIYILERRLSVFVNTYFLVLLATLHTSNRLIYKRYYRSHLHNKYSHRYSLLLPYYILSISIFPSSLYPVLGDISCCKDMVNTS